jgi:hypothetical protein
LIAEPVARRELDRSWFGDGHDVMLRDVDVAVLSAREAALVGIWEALVQTAAPATIALAATEALMGSFPSRGDGPRAMSTGYGAKR